MSIFLTLKAKNEKRWGKKKSLWRLLIYNRKKEELNVAETDGNFLYVDCSLLIAFLRNRGIIKNRGIMENKRFNLNGDFSLPAKIHAHKENHSLKDYNDTYGTF